MSQISNFLSLLKNFDEKNAVKQELVKENTVIKMCVNLTQLGSKAVLNAGQNTHKKAVPSNEKRFDVLEVPSLLVALAVSILYQEDNISETVRAKVPA